MARAYSDDLRKRVADAIEAETETLAEIAARFDLGVATVKRWWWRVRDTGSPDAKPHGGGRSLKFTPEAVDMLTNLLNRRPDMTRAELAQHLAEAGGPTVSLATMGRQLERMGWTRKKKPSEPARWTRRASRTSATGT
jgi:transposase